MQTLIAAFGNELRGDDGFGIAVLRYLETLSLDRAGTVRLLEVGTAGLRLAQELLTPCDRLVLVDAVCRGGVPGTLYTLEVCDVAIPDAVDMHLAVPARALGLARALGASARETFLVGCEPLEVNELTFELSAPVRSAVAPAAHEVLALIGRPMTAEPLGRGPGA